MVLFEAPSAIRFRTSISRGAQPGAPPAIRNRTSDPAGRPPRRQKSAGSEPYGGGRFEQDHRSPPRNLSSYRQVSCRFASRQARRRWPNRRCRACRGTPWRHQSRNTWLCSMLHLRCGSAAYSAAPLPRELDVAQHLEPHSTDSRFINNLSAHLIRRKQHLKTRNKTYALAAPYTRQSSHQNLSTWSARINSGFAVKNRSGVRPNPERGSKLTLARRRGRRPSRLGSCAAIRSASVGNGGRAPHWPVAGSGVGCDGPAVGSNLRRWLCRVQCRRRRDASRLFRVR